MSGSEEAAPIPGLSHIPQVQVGYLNFPRLRTVLLSSQYVRAFRRIVLDGLRPDGILCYNVYPHSVAMGHEAMRLSIPWIPVVADAPGDPVAYGRLEQQLGIAAGCIFLSWSSFSRWNASPKLHLDGGVSTVPEHELDTPTEIAQKIIFYSGSLNKYGGIDLLLDAFALIRDPNVRLWVCGKGDNNKLRQMLCTDSRITFFGCIAEGKLQELSRQASVMVNPRPSDIPDSQHNFPSKVLEYFTYGKPVVSTWTPGLSPEYRPFLTVPRAETAAALASSVLDVLSWTPGQRYAYAAGVGTFLRKGKTWGHQAGRLLTWWKENNWGSSGRRWIEE
ncbi:MAG: glycosyltransferase [Myxococcales bacterium]|nr:MAG: glycosyltransferase [Myxococcales bacterium]